MKWAWEVPAGAQHRRVGSRPGGIDTQHRRVVFRTGGVDHKHRRVWAGPDGVDHQHHRVRAGPDGGALFSFFSPSARPNSQSPLHRPKSQTRAPSTGAPSPSPGRTAIPEVKQQISLPWRRRLGRAAAPSVLSSPSALPATSVSSRYVRPLLFPSAV